VAKALEWRDRLNQIPGVNVPIHAISRRPSIPLQVLTDDAVMRQFLAVLDWLKTCPRKTHSVTSGEKIRSNQSPSVVSARAIASAVRTFVNGNSPSWRNWRLRKHTWARKEPGLEYGMRGASLPGRDRLATSILASETPFAYLICVSRLVKNYVPFERRTDAEDGSHLPRAQ
jgi:hypothetical protein